MWLWDWMMGRESTVSVAATVEPSVTFSHDIPTPVDKLISGMKATGSSVRASRTDALSVTAVLRGRNLICSISTLPLNTLAKDRTPVRSPLLEQIDPNVANVVTLAQTLEDLLFEGIAWWRVIARDANDFPMQAVHVSESAVSVQGPTRVSQQTLPSGFQPGGTVWVNGVEVPHRDMIRFDSPNPGILTVAGRAIRRAVLLERTATMYGEDPRMLDYFSPVDGADPVEDDEIRDILDTWQEARRQRSTGYVPAALEYHTVTGYSPAELQLVEMQKKATIDLANAMGVDPEDLGVSTTSRTYQNATDRRRDRINDTLAPFMRAITDRLSMNDVTRRGQQVVFVLDDYMKADPKTRWETHKIAAEIQALSMPEIRESEGLPAIPVEGRLLPRAPRPTPTTERQTDEQEIR